MRLPPAEEWRGLVALAGGAALLAGVVVGGLAERNDWGITGAVVALTLVLGGLAAAMSR